MTPTGTGLGSASVSIGYYSMLTDSNGNFTLHATAGKNIVKVLSFMSTQYYVPAREVNLPADEIKDLGTITLLERTAHITGTVCHYFAVLLYAG